ncbi:FSR family fosmidomycin resistance protein-like MFS transporter [Evansella vedderi]|uniref:FSR family fosmidomycin resistance protein-like MFS transporter n=1 Tax=Evansella vedderi TaxID=38282 RepID=A0ABU0A1L2_9BACI|nr:MFS transporter [Evansella vedderi]MDQ0256598.1 FSR family fosmidomycin resistance protein-like MFS transporter [Evansella vedderi]
MQGAQKQVTSVSASSPEQKTMYKILVIIGFVHLLNDSIQAVIPAMFPVLQQSMGLTFTQLGLIAFALNLTASIIQPVVGLYTDKKPSPYALPIGLCFTFVGVIGLAFAPSFWFLILSVIFVGLGSATFHPEGSRVAYMAAGSRRGLAQSIFQVGGNTGQALAPLITALILVPLGQFGAIWFAIVAALAVALLMYIARWYSDQVKNRPLPVKKVKKPATVETSAKEQSGGKRKIVLFAISLLIFLVFARSWFHAGITNYYAFYLIDQFNLSIAQAQVYIFIFLGTGAIGTFAGGPLADRFGKRNMIMLSMVGSAPLALILPHAGPALSYVLLGIIGFIILSSFSVTVVYAQELVPGKIGTVSGLIIGLAFGMGAVGSIALGWFIDLFGLTSTILFAVALPLIGILTMFLPSDQRLKEINES